MQLINKNQRQLRFKFFILLFLLLTIIGCNNQEYPIEIKDGYTSIVLGLSSISEFLSTYDLISDLISSNELISSDNPPSLPLGTRFLAVDTSLIDGDGYEFLIDFGELGNLPLGTLCKDFKYRAGALHVYLDQNYLNTSEMTIVLSSDHPFYSGDGKEMTQLEGRIVLKQDSQKNMIVTGDDIQITNTQGHIELSTDIIIHERETGSTNQSSKIITINGSMQLTNDVEIQDYTIVSPLLKKSDNSCIRHILSGNIAINPFIENMVIDFDPYSDSGCDNLISLTVNGKRTFLNY